MKQLFTSFLTVLLLMASSVSAQESITFPYVVSEGMPGDTESNIVTDDFGYSLLEQYVWSSPIYSTSESIKGVRLTFIESNYATLHNNYPMVALSELHFYDANGSELMYNEYKVSYNSLELSEGSISGLNDNNISTYYHSVWKYAMVDNDDYVYLDITFPKSVTSFSFSYRTRNLNIAPLAIALTNAGVTYNKDTDGGAQGGVSGGGSTGVGSGDDTDNDTTAVAYTPVDVLSTPTLFVCLSDGGVDAYPLSSLDGEYYSIDGTLYVPLSGSDAIEYPHGSYTGYTTDCPSLPTLTSYKFNNKYNPNLNVDVIADSISDVMTFDLNAIGKSLTASFQLSDDRAVAYIGNEVQYSKESRRRFSGPVQYVVTYPGYNVLSNVKVQDEIWDTGDDIVSEIPLTSEMLYTNKPSEVGDDLYKMLDNDPTTIFHTVYGANYDAGVMPYITITLDAAVSALQFYYMTRTGGNYNPSQLNLYVSADGSSWQLVRGFSSSADSLPLDPAGAEYTSPTVDLGGSYRYIKLEQTASEYHNNHMVFAEFRLYDVVPGNKEPVKIQDAVYENVKMPFGRIYTINPNWLVDSGQAPRIDIDIDGGYFVTSKDYYLNANFRISGFGVYDDFEDSVQIKGRGNSTWNYSKKPYRLKFSSAVKPFGLTKGKSWVLLANAQNGALLANAVAMKVGQLVGAPYTNHIIPVELYMNGVYMGNYMFTEHVGFSNNSVDIDEDSGTGYMLELDDYYDEDYKFKSENFALPVNVKEPDLADYSAEEAETRFQAIKDDFNKLDAALAGSMAFEGYLDIDAFARFMLVNNIVMNKELGHPKSTFLWKEDITSTSSKIVFGPLWDFDWAFGYEDNSSYCYTTPVGGLFEGSMAVKPGGLFFTALMNNQAVLKHYYKVWREFVDKGCIEELIDYVGDYYDFAKNSLEHNYTAWYDGYGYDIDTKRTQDWLKQRCQYLDANIDSFDITEFLYPLLGDVNMNNVITIKDVALIGNFIAGNQHVEFNRSKADVRKDLLVNSRDAEAVASQLLAAESLSSLYYYNTPTAYAQLFAEDFEIQLDGIVTLPYIFEEYADECHTALQLDVKVPVGMSINDVVAGSCLSGHKLMYNQLSEDMYRIVAYSDTNSAFAVGDTLFEISLYAYDIVPMEQRNITVGNVLAVSDNGVAEVRVDDVVTSFDYATAIKELKIETAISGGDCLVVTSAAPQTLQIFAVDGRLVRSLHVEEGTTRIDMPSGIYIANGVKVVIR